MALDRDWLEWLDLLPLGAGATIAGCFVYMNPAGAAILGAASPADVIGRSVTELAPADRLRAIRDGAAERRAQAEPAPAQGLRVARLDGSGDTVDLDMIAFPWGPDDWNGYMALFLDVTETKRQERLLEQHADDLALINALNTAANAGEPAIAILERMCQALVAMGSGLASAALLCEEGDHCLTLAASSVSDEAASRVREALGVPLRDLICRQMPVSDAPHLAEVALSRRSLVIEGAEAISALITELFGGQDAAGAAEVVYDRLGCTHVVNVPLCVGERGLGTLQLALEAAPAPRLVSRLETIAHQVSAMLVRIRSEAQLAEAEETMRLVLNASHDAVLLLDASFRVLYANAETQRRLGRCLREMLGRHVKELYDPASVESFQQVAMGVLQEHRPDRVEIREGPHIFDVHLHPLADPAGVPRLVVYVRETTEEHDRRQQMVRSARMEAIGQLASGLAHEFKNNLTVISGYAQILAKRLAADDPNREAVEEMLAATRRASQVAQRTLALSRESAPDFRRVQLSDLIVDLGRLFQRLLPDTVRLSVFPNEEAWPTRCHVGDIESVLLNLVLNARDALMGKEQGLVDVWVCNRVVTPKEAASVAGGVAGEFVELGVCDDGVGMTPEVLHECLEPYFTTKPPGEGTGLGLATAAEVARQAGGFILVNSQEGSGTCVMLYLPHDRRDADDAPGDEAEDAAGVLEGPSF
jgi:PAS domain S-box-containing protein